MKTKILFIALISFNQLNAQVNSLALTGDLLPIYDATLSFVSGDYTLDFTIRSSIGANLFFASPDGGSGAGSFRSLTIADAPFAVNTSTSQSVGGTKTFTSDLSISGSTTNLFLTDGVDQTVPSLAFTSNTGSGFGYSNSTKTLFLSLDEVYRYQFLRGEFDMKDGTNFVSGSGKLSINITHDADINGQDGGISVSTYGGTGTGAGNKKCATFGGRTSSGTEAMPSNTIADQRLAEFIGKGFTTDWESDNRGVYGIYAAENHIGSAQGAYCKIRTTRLSTDQAHNSILIDPAGNLGLTNNTTIPQSFPSGWSGTTDYDSRFLSIESFTSTASDVGLFIQNSSGSRGLNIWLDNSAKTTFFDNIINNNSGIIQTRLKTATTPVVAITTGLFTPDGGTNYYGGTNFGTDATPDNVFTVGAASEFQVSGYGKVVKYDNTSTVNGGIPSEIHEEHGVGKTAVSGILTLLSSAPADGYYRVNWMATITIAGTGASTLGPFTVTFTNPSDGVNKTWPSANTNNINGTTANNTTSGIISGCMTVYAKSGTPITCAFNYTSVTGMTYDYYVLLEKL